MNQPSHEVHKISIEGDQFVVHGREGQRLFSGSYQEVEVWLDHGENAASIKLVDDAACFCKVFSRPFVDRPDNIRCVATRRAVPGRVHGKLQFQD